MQRKRRGAMHQPTQNALVFYLISLSYMLIVSLLYFVSFAPLLTLVLTQPGSGLRALTLLCPALGIAVLLPLRMSFAQAMNARCHGEAFSLQTAFNTSLYGEKLAEGVLYMLHLIKWAIPLAGAFGVLYYLYTDMEAFTLIKAITDFGLAVTAVWNGLMQFITGLFGGGGEWLPGGITEGLYAILGIVGLCALFFVWGVVRNSAYRYIWAEATELDKNPHFEARRSLRGRRFAQLGVALINLLLLLPALFALYRLIDPLQTVEALASQYADALVTQTALPPLSIPYGKLALVFFACYLPLLPLRRMLTATFATARFRRPLVSPEQAQPSAAQPLLYEDKPAAPANRRG